MRQVPVLLVALLLGCTPKSQEVDALSRPAKHASVPDRPEELSFPEMTFTPPRAADYRHELSNGVPVFVVPADDLPLVTVTFTFQGGRYLDPTDQTGLADLTYDLLRDGGTAQRSPEELDEAYAFLAANVSSSVDNETGVITVDVLKDNLDEALSLFGEMVKTPGFDAARLQLSADTWVEDMKSRNDDAGAIVSREWNRLMYGEGHVAARVATASEVQAITPDHLRAFHSRYIHPGNLVVGVTGDVQPNEILPKLEALMEGWEAQERVAPPEEPAHQPIPGMYHVQKDIPQGKVRLGLAGVQRGHPDTFPLLVMNDILGGGGFTSRIMGRVRSDEGLAYGASSAMQMPAWWPGLFVAAFDSKNPTVALATQIVVEEIERIRTEPVSDTELRDAKAGLNARLPRTFASKQGMVRVFIDDELTGRDPDFWQDWQENVNAVTADDVLRAAAEHLTPEQLVFLVVGDWEPIAAGDPAGRANMEPFGGPTHLPLRDPLTQAPLP